MALQRHAWNPAAHTAEPSSIEQVRRIRAIPAKKTDVPLVDYLSIGEMEAMLNDLPAAASIDLQLETYVHSS
jgi:hypothetical protein